MPLRRGGRPGLIGLAARTAVEAGTTQARIDAAAQAALTPAPSVVPAPAIPAGSEVLGQLQQLAELKQSGLLTDEEFTAAKAKLLG